MNPTTPQFRETVYFGHVKNGVILLDTEASLPEGQAVRVEALPEQPAISEETADRLQRMRTLFAQWREEDGHLTDDQAERLETALQQNRGLTLRLPKLD
jgi:hypothetical protein